MKTASLAMLACGAMATVSSLGGAILVFTATGQVTGTRDFITNGDPVSMTFSYDDSASGSIYAGGTQGSYVGLAQGVYNMRIDIQTVSNGTWSATSSTGNIAVNNPGAFNDSFQATSTLPPETWTSPINGNDPEGFKVEFINYTENVFNNVDLPSTLSAGMFEKLTGTVYLGDFSFFQSVHFSVTDIQAVPEPGTYALIAGLATLGLVAYRRRRA